MFDIGFSEMVVIAIVALIVIGPERLPKVARTLGHLFGRMQRYVNDVKSDISREMELDELRKLQATVEDAARAIETSVRTEVSSAESALNKVAAEASVTAELQAVASAVEAPPLAGTVAAAEPPAAIPPSSVTAAETPPVNATVGTAPAAAPQLELGLESAPPAHPAQKQA